MHRLYEKPLRIAFAAALTAVGILAAAVEAQQGPTDAVRVRNEAVVQALESSGDSVSDATREELKDVINGLIDFPELSRRALGRHWDPRTPEEQEEFVGVFRELVRNSSVRKLEVYEADSIVYRPAEIDGAEAVVTTVAHEGDKSVEVVYLLHLLDGVWKAYDVIIDGSSTMRTYQDSFNRQIRRGSFREMVDQMSEKLEKDRAGTGSASLP
jgi:phospholipid transport system substrate-binding protein